MRGGSFRAPVHGVDQDWLTAEAMCNIQAFGTLRRAGTASDMGQFVVDVELESDPWKEHALWYAQIMLRRTYRPINVIERSAKRVAARPFVLVLS